MSNTDRLKIEPYKDVLYCEARMDDEFTVADLNLLREEIRAHYQGCIDIIMNKVGEYSVSVETQRILRQGIAEFRHFAYVVESKVKRASAEFAASTYMAPYRPQITGSKEHAYVLLHAIAHVK